MLTDILCPTCSATGTENRLTMTSRGLVCVADHKFTDTAELLALSPKRVKVEQAVKKQPGVTDFVVQIPTGLIEKLGKRFGDKLNASVAAILGVMLDPRSFIIVSEDVQKIEEYLGVQQVKSGAALVGGIYALFTQRNELRAQAEQKISSVGSTDGSTVMEGDTVKVQIQVGVETFIIIREKAKFNSMSFSQYAQEVLSLAVKNSWL